MWPATAPSGTGFTGMLWSVIKPCRCRSRECAPGHQLQRPIFLSNALAAAVKIDCPHAVDPAALPVNDEAYPLAARSCRLGNVGGTAIFWRRYIAEAARLQGTYD